MPNPLSLFDINEELTECSTFSRFSQADIVWVKRSGKKVALIKAGDYFFADRIETYKKLNVEIDSYVSEERILEFVSLMEAYKSSEFLLADKEKRKEELDNNILNWLARVFWTGSEEGSLVELVIALEKVFFSISDDGVEYLINKSELLFKRNSKYSSLMVCLAFIVGYRDYEFLKDLYNLTYFMDIDLLERNLDSIIVQGLEEERVYGKRGLKLLESKNMKKDKEALLTHIALLTREKIDSFYQSRYFDEIKNVFSFHHEKISGDGFPKGMNGHELSDLEVIVIFINGILPFKDFSYEKRDGREYFKFIFNMDDERKHSVVNHRLEEIVYGVFKVIVGKDFQYKSLESLFR